MCRSKQTPDTAHAHSKDLPPNTAPFFPNIFYNNQFRAKPIYPPSTTSLAGQTTIITGANSGIGFECARQLLSLHLSTCILAVRSPTTKGADAANKLRNEYPDADIRVWELNMSSYESIQQFVTRLQRDAEVKRVDYVVLNAGVNKHKFGTVPETGYEEMFFVNYLSQALLNILLVPVLKAKREAFNAAAVASGGDGQAQTHPAHITWVNGALSLFAKFPNRNARPLLPSFNDEKAFSSGERYNTTKLLAHFFVWKLTDEFVSGEDVVVSVTDPGYVRGTNLASELKEEVMQMKGALGSTIRWAARNFEKTARSLEDGTSTIVDALVNKGVDAHGCFLMGWKIAPFATMLYRPEGKEIMECLWRETVDEFQFANVDGILAAMKASKEIK